MKRKSAEPMMEAHGSVLGYPADAPREALTHVSEGERGAACLRNEEEVSQWMNCSSCESSAPSQCD